MGVLAGTLIPFIAMFALIARVRVLAYFYQIFLVLDLLLVTLRLTVASIYISLPILYKHRFSTWHSTNLAYKSDSSSSVGLKIVYRAVSVEI